MSGNETQSVNSHIEDYLDYYCGLSHSPGFAVLLKGEWGCGKTWFVKKYLEKLERQKEEVSQNQPSIKNILRKLPFKNVSNIKDSDKITHKPYLYVSLYGIMSRAEIEAEFLRQLFPFWSSQEASIIKNFAIEAIKSKFRFNSNSLIENLVRYFKKDNKTLLIFDDLERCKIDISDILGYINNFVEHQGHKVIIIANEEKLLKKDKYKDIKEKLIGMTFDICFDLDGALKDFIKEIDNPKIKDFLSNNIQLIEEIYEKAEYQNLRCLKQIILDFERIFQKLPDKARNKSELLQEILQILIAFSIEIKRGALLPRNISKLQEALVFEVTEARRDSIKRRSSNNQSSSSKASSDDDREQDNIKELISLKKIIDRYQYPILKQLIYQPLPSLEWWEIFFNQGIINNSKLEDSILNSKHFQDENMPNWMRLWHFENSDMTDDEFDDLLKKVESEYADREFQDIGVIKHITGLFLYLSSKELYSKNKQNILEESKLYIDNLIADNQFDLNLKSDTIRSSTRSMNSYKNLGFQGKELKEFKEFREYIKTARESAIKKSLPKLGIELLEIMQSDIWRFYRMICCNNSHNIIDNYNEVYSEVPIFNYIKANDFMENLLSISFNDQQYCLYGLQERYKFEDINKKLFEELDWLKDIQNLLLDEANQRKGKLSGYKLQLLNTELNQAIEKLEALPINQEVI